MLNDWISYINSNGKRSKRYRDYCYTCSKDKGYLRKSRLGKECHSCNSKTQAVVGATHGGKSAQIIELIREKRKQQVIKHSEETKRKIAESNRISKRRNLEARGLTKKTPEQKRLGKGISALLSRYLKKRKISKRSKTVDAIGFTVDDLKKHLESLFQPRMTWDNYGEWHIDHIIPDSYFKYNSIKDEDFKKSWCLSNLQPLWAIDNLRKGAKIYECV